MNLHPEQDHAWFAPANTVVLWCNLKPGNGGATGIGDPAVRRAVRYGIDRNAHALLGESGHEQAASSSSALIEPNQKANTPPSFLEDLSTTGNVPDAAPCAEAAPWHRRARVRSLAAAPDARRGAPRDSGCVHEWSVASSEWPNRQEGDSP